MIKNSSEGFSWTPSTGFAEGLPTIGVVDPPQGIRSNQDDIYDVIIVGAGYAGLIASRDLSTQGRTLLRFTGQRAQR